MGAPPDLQCDNGITVRYRGEDYALHVDPSTTTVATLCTMLCSEHAQARISTQTAKLLQQGKLAASSPDVTLQQAGVGPGSRVVLLASTVEEVAGVRSQRELPGLASFEHEMVSLMRRQRRADAVSLPTGPYTFGTFQTWQPPEGVAAHPPPSTVLAVLHRLAADPGIRAVMAERRWAVPLLAEMPPEGLVGVDPVCVLGYNTNNGQSIHLRLRTDDLRGLRNYQRVRETLVHELAHNVHSDHGAGFKALNSQLLREVGAHDAAARNARTLAAFGGPGAAGGAAAWDGEVDGGAWVEGVDAMAATRALSGRTLRQLGGGGAAVAAEGAAAADAAARAALQRQQEAAAAAGAASATAGAVVAAEEQRARTITAAAAAAPVPAGEGEVAEEDEDEGTRAAEAAMRRLGGLPTDLPAQALFLPPPEGATAAAQSHAAASASAAAAAAAAAADSVQSLPPADIGGGEAQLGLPGTTTAAAGAAAAAEAAKPARGATLGLPAAAAVQPPPPLPPLQPEQPAADAEMQDAKVSTSAAKQHQGEEQQCDAADDADDVLEGLPPDDPMAERFRRMEASLAQLTSAAAPGDAREALSTLAVVLRNAASAAPGGDAKHRRLRLANPGFRRRVARHPGAVALLVAAGFAEEEEEVQQGVTARGVGGGGGKVLRLRRDDPALLWLASTAVQRTLRRVPAV